MKYPTIYHFSMATAVGMTLSLLAMGDADAYTFSRLLDDSGPYNFSSYLPAINNQGTVAFNAQLDSDQWPLEDSSRNFSDRDIIFTSNAQALTPILPNRFIPGFGTIPRLGIFGGYLDINDSDTVAFYELQDSPRQGQPYQVLLTGDGETLKTITDTRDYWNIFGDIAINDEGTVVFRDRGAYGIFTSDGMTRTTIVDNSDSLNSLGDTLAINNQGTVAFEEYSNTGGLGIFTSRNGSITPIAETNGLFTQLGTFSLNDSDTVAFAAVLEDGSEGIFISNSGSSNRLVDTHGSFSSLFSPAINNHDTVAFGAKLETGEYGIFTGTDPVADKVIAVGDKLFGSTVTSLGFSHKGFNDMGQVAFLAELADGTRGIFRADPDGVSIDLGGTGSKPAQASFKSIEIDDFSGQETLLDYELDSIDPYQSIPPAYIVNDVVHIGCLDDSEYLPLTNNINPPSIAFSHDSGVCDGSLSILFPELPNRLGFGFSLAQNEGFVADVGTVNLFDAAENLLGTLSFDGDSDPDFAGGFFGVESTVPFRRAEITFNERYPTFILDNLRYEFVKPATVPEPATGLGLLVMSAIGAGSALRRKQK